MSEMTSSLDVACIDDGVRELFGPCGKPTFSDSTTCFAVLHDQVTGRLSSSGSRGPLP